MVQISSLIVLALPLLVTAGAVPRGGEPDNHQCSTGETKCCQSVEMVYNVPDLHDHYSDLIV
jgi:hypothetical protein